MGKTTVALWGSVWLVFLCVLASAEAASDTPRSTDAEERVLATVNGVTITEIDLQQGLKRKTRGERVSEDAKKTFLETLVREELASQAASRLGLDGDPTYRKQLREAEAQLRAFRRENLAHLYRDKVLIQEGVTDADALAYFEKNADRIQSSVHVWQIAYKANADWIADDGKDLKAGMPFAKVAGRRYPNLPKGLTPPWDLGYLHWSLVPKAWRDVLATLKPGDTSGIIEGEQGRLWIIHLVDRKVLPSVSFESEKEKILEVLGAEQGPTRYEESLRALRERAEVVFSD